MELLELKELTEVNGGIDWSQVGGAMAGAGGGLIGGAAGAKWGAGVGSIGGPAGALIGGAIGSVGGVIIYTLWD